MKLTCPTDENALVEGFEHKGKIPEIYALNYGNQQPALECEDIPKNTVSLTIIVDDPDAKKVPKKLGGQGKIWVHWTIWNLAVTHGNLPDSKPSMGLGPDTVSGMTSFQRTGYDGPAPPDKEHTYRFSIFALDTKLSLDSKATKTDLMKAMKGHILDQDTLLGTFEDPELRKKREAKDKK
tara:strand:- start:14 stop:553 length:540 start_codon:yes stop_codon:yes gene_type:complete